MTRPDEGVANTGRQAMISRRRGCGSGRGWEELFPALAGPSWGWRSRWRRTACPGLSPSASTLGTVTPVGRAAAAVIT